MLLRVWKAWADAPGASAYRRHYQQHVLPELSAIPGFLEAKLVERTQNDEVELISLVQFDSMDAVRSFAGDDIDTAVVAEQAQAVLTRFDDKVVHYEIVVTS